MKNVLITGATSGIGEEFARKFARRGYRLILTGRNEEKLVELSNTFGGNTRRIVADLTKESQCHELLDALEGERIDVFINNAGFGDFGDFTETDLEKELNMIKVNDIAMHILFKGILKKMVSNNRGVILNVASVAGLLPAGPHMATYYATKAYVVNLTRAVARELKEKKSKVYVCALCPGPVKTNFNATAGVRFLMPGITPEKCVDEAFEGMKRKKNIILPTRMLRTLMGIGTVLPENLLVLISSKIQRK